MIAPAWPPERLLREFVCVQRIDLTVIGTQGADAIFELMIGSTARRIIDAVPGDIFLVREPREGRRDR